MRNKRPHPRLLFSLLLCPVNVSTFCNIGLLCVGAKPPGELQVPSPPEPEPTGEAVPDAGLQAGLLGGFGSRRAASTHSWPAASHGADHEERTHGAGQ